MNSKFSEPKMAAGITDRLWEMIDDVDVLSKPQSLMVKDI